MQYTSAADVIEAALPTLMNRSFAGSLLSQFRSKGKLSEKQGHYFIKIANEIIERRDNPPAPAPIEKLGDFTGVIDLFTKAKGKLQHPKLHLDLADGTEVCLSVAGAAAKAPGTVNVTDGMPFGQNKWYGRVHPNGNWEQNPRWATEIETVGALLAALAANPANVAAAYGHKSGRCCFCRKELTDERSVTVGYGSTCAKNWGLPWGK